MSTEEPAAPGLRTDPIWKMTWIGGVELTSGMMLNLGPDDYFYSEDWHAFPAILLEITRVGEVLPDGEFIYIEGRQHAGAVKVLARGIAVRIKSLKDCLKD